MIKSTALEESDTAVRYDGTVTEDEMKGLKKESQAKAMIHHGYNVMFVKDRNALDVNELLQEVVTKHFANNGRCCASTFFINSNRLQYT